ncbi:L-threonylcarbamoyladenylate synthase [Dryocola sp. BD626]|jgi:L-threonylcarbamoyladenylate synthase|uniref:L-threonylcarbamoyladenylate synthase n=1 Tax=Dryocola sp. BD626 TaxID=3133273 RepID=UPI003F4F742C
MSFIEKAVTVLRNEGVILVPTDTHYALAANPLCQHAMEKLAALQQTLRVDEMTYCFNEVSGIWRWIEVTPWQRLKIELLSQLYWPGALKMTLRRQRGVLPYSPAGDELSVVCVKNTLLRGIIAAFDHPLVVIPAASLAEKGPLVSFTLAREGLGDIVDLVVPSNSKNTCRQATTHISLLNDIVTLIRPGELDISDFL